MKFRKNTEKKLKSKGIVNRLLALITLILMLSAYLLSCNEQKKITPKSRVYYEYFNTDLCTIYDYSGKSDEEFRQVYLHFEDRLNYYHKLFDIYHEYEGVNNLATVNRLAGQSAVKVDKELIDFLEYAKEIYTLTDGYVNVAMGSVLSLWHEARNNQVRIPTAEELSEANLHTDISNLVIDREASTVYLSDPETSLDVGALAKGYTAERIAQSLMSRGISSYVLDLGGNLRIIGTKVDGGGWKTGVKNPDLNSSKKYVYEMTISDTSMVTSGDYWRNAVIDGVKYHHIINKDTLMPADYFSSVTVVTKDSGLADALSTALFSMSYDAGVALIDEIGDVSAIWVTPEGEVLTHGINE